MGTQDALVAPRAGSRLATSPACPAAPSTWASRAFSPARSGSLGAITQNRPGLSSPATASDRRGSSYARAAKPALSGERFLGLEAHRGRMHHGGDAHCGLHGVLGNAVL